MSTELLMVLFTAIGAFLTKSVDWIFNRKSHKADASGKELNNLEKMHEVYTVWLDDLTKRYEEKYKQITGLYEDKIKLLEDQIGILKRNNRVLKEENAALRQQIKELTKNT